LGKAGGSVSNRKAKTLGVYAGSFDPPTVGHVWMIEQAVRLFEDCVVAIGINPDKKYTFGLQERLRMLRMTTRGYRNLSVASFSNRYLIEYAQSIGATHILRGIRSASGVRAVESARSRSPRRRSTAPTPSGWPGRPARSKPGSAPTWSSSMRRATSISSTTSA